MLSFTSLLILANEDRLFPPQHTQICCQRLSNPPVQENNVKEKGERLNHSIFSKWGLYLKYFPLESSNDTISPAPVSEQTETTTTVGQSVCYPEKWKETACRLTIKVRLVWQNFFPKKMIKGLGCSGVWGGGSCHWQSSISFAFESRPRNLKKKLVCWPQRSGRSVTPTFHWLRDLITADLWYQASVFNASAVRMPI